MSATGYFVSRSDDSTFLTDEYYGNTLLLPNRDLLNAYQLIDWSGWFEAHPGVALTPALETFWMNIIKVLSGYPSLPFNFRSGNQNNDRWGGMEAEVTNRRPLAL